MFTPGTAGDFSDSLRFIIEQGGPDITFNFSSSAKWGPGHLETLKKEMERLADYLAFYYKKTGGIPVKNFRPSGAKPGMKLFGNFLPVPLSLSLSPYLYHFPGLREGGDKTNF